MAMFKLKFFRPPLFRFAYIRKNPPAPHSAVQLQLFGATPSATRATKKTFPLGPKMPIVEIVSDQLPPQACRRLGTFGFWQAAITFRSYIETVSRRDYRSGFGLLADFEYFITWWSIHFCLSVIALICNCCASVHTVPSAPITVLLTH